MIRKDTVKLMCLAMAIFAAMAVQADAQQDTQRQPPPQTQDQKPELPRAPSPAPATATNALHAPDRLAGAFDYLDAHAEHGHADKPTDRQQSRKQGDEPQSGKPDEDRPQLTR